MELPSKTIERYKKQSSVSNITYHNEQWFNHNFVKDNIEFLKGGKKYTLETELKEHQGLTEPMNKKTFQVGKIYTFNYSNPKYKKELKFYNAFPVGLCLGHVILKNGKQNPLFLNLTFIPPKIRILIMDKLVKIFNNNFINPNIEKLNRGVLNLKQLPTEYQVLKKILANSGFEFAIRSYIYTRIKTKPRVISYIDWWKICTFSSKFIKKINILAIYALYKKNMLDSNYRIGKKDPKVRIANTKLKDILGNKKT